MKLRLAAVAAFVVLAATGFTPTAVHSSAVHVLDTPFEVLYSWSPPAGYVVVEETYVKPNAPGSLVGYRRGVIFADTRTVADQTWLDRFPHNTTPPTVCNEAGIVVACPAADKRSAMAFQRAMVVADPPYPF